MLRSSKRSIIEKRKKNQNVWASSLNLYHYYGFGGYVYYTILLLAKEAATILN